jgi:hypothetical protein
MRISSWILIKSIVYRRCESLGGNQEVVFYQLLSLYFLNLPKLEAGHAKYRFVRLSTKGTKKAASIWGYFRSSDN